ncbi:MAG: YdjY domain-containing protein [Phycisphaerales bacterium]
MISRRERCGVPRTVALSVTVVLGGCATSPSGKPLGWALGTRSPVTAVRVAAPVAQIVSEPEVAEQPPLAGDQAPAPALREVFPHVRVDTASKVVEFDAHISPMLMPDPQAPLFFLESVVCTPDTREHESLLVTRARPSHIHAALLLIGLTPGEPGRWRLDNNRLMPVDPTGDRVIFEVEWTDAAAGADARRIDPTAWIVNARDRSRLGAQADPMHPGRPSPGWVFAGSRMVRTSFLPDGTPIPAGQPDREVYAADEAGAVIGLATFGDELIALSRTFSPDAHIDVPEWIADFRPEPPTPAPPQPQTAVIVRIRPGPALPH